MPLYKNTHTLVEALCWRLYVTSGGFLLWHTHAHPLSGRAVCRRVMRARSHTHAGSSTRAALRRPPGLLSCNQQADPARTPPATRSSCAKSCPLGWFMQETHIDPLRGRRGRGSIGGRAAPVWKRLNIYDTITQCTLPLHLSLPSRESDKSIYGGYCTQVSSPSVSHLCVPFTKRKEKKLSKQNLNWF